ncbi:GNAT family N-acetyltransferase [Nocardioides sp. Bht2]|uniref:GNAT family N-acetyltransferase n=1 Tax=Nocardioides sp. Bht2 TaxID=3392297 RepID=UPI0039B53089
MPSLTFRNADLDDVAAVVALVESAYRGDASRAGWTTEADLLHGQRTDADDVRAAIQLPGSVLLAGFDGGDLVTCCNLQHREDRAYFGMFAVSPTRQGDGIGRQVLAHAETFARSTWAATHLEMTVIRQRTDLIAYYERRGYRDTRQRSPFPYGDERFGIPQRADLEFTLLEKPLHR